MKAKNDSRRGIDSQPLDGPDWPDPALPDEAQTKRGARALGLAPSRTELRREALDVLVLAERLLELSPSARERLDLGEAVQREVAMTLSIHSHGARKRQVQFLAKQLRRDADSLAVVRAAVEARTDTRRRDAAELHRIERWRDRLLDEGDAAIGDLLTEHPEHGFERQQLRTLVRQATAERAAGRPPAAARQLFKLLREALD